MRSLQSAISSDPDYITLIASKRKGDKLMNRLLKKGMDKNNLKKINATFPLGKFICVTGVSGSGKSTLLFQALYLSLIHI